MRDAAAVRCAYNALRDDLSRAVGAERDATDEALLASVNRAARAADGPEHSVLRNAVAAALCVPPETPTAELAAWMSSMRDSGALQRGLVEALGAGEGTSADELLEEVKRFVGARERCGQLERENAALWEQKVAETRKRHDADWEAECAVERADAAAVEAAALRERAGVLEAEISRLEEACAETGSLRRAVLDLEGRCAS
jgi:hypothetical protein